MKKIVLASALLLLSGCGTIIPLKRHFPAPVPELMQRCPDLKQTAPTDKLSDVVTVVVDNYGQYHYCQDKNDKWIAWYNQQKQLFDNVGKKK